MKKTAAALLLMVSSSAYAQSAPNISNADLEMMCEGISLNRTPTEPQLACAMYINGFFGGYHTLSWMIEQPLFCTPVGGTTAQYGRVFAKWSAEHPELAHEVASKGFFASLIAAFPCPSTSG